MPFLIALVLACCTALFAVEQEQPTPYDLIRPIWPMTWDTAATDNGGTVESFSSYQPFTKKRNTVPPVGSVPQDFKPNGLIPDSLNQAFRDAQNVRIGRIRINQAGYLPEDDEKQFYYVSAGTCAETYVVVDLEGNPVSEPATLTSSGKATTSSWSIRAGSDAATANQGRYRVDGQGPEGTVCIGHLADVGGLETETRYRIKILDQYSATFIISDKVFSMVRDATLKFYGINRSGNSESWFHKPSHVKDGGGTVVVNAEKPAAVEGFTSQEGALQGGWYDCGDHLKESQTQAYAFMVLAVMAVANPDRDEDHYAYNMGETVNTDGIPDILREAKHGADFFLRAYRFAKGVIDNMPVSVGHFGFDHSWWGRPENQDNLPPTLRGRGGPHERDVRLGELGSNISGQIAAGLALLSVNYATYDKAFADSCLMVAEELYDFAKNLALGKKSYGLAKYDKSTNQPYVYNTVPAGWSTPAYNGNNEYHDDLAMAAWALHYATYAKTGDMSYLEDAISNKEMVTGTGIGADKFPGGWMGSSSNGMLKSSKNTSWANAYTYALYGFYRVLLRDTETAAKYGISEKDRLSYSEKILYTMAANISYLQKEGSNSIDLPNPNNEVPLKLSYTDLWYNMQTDQTWIYNRYQSGNIFEVLAYSEIAKDFEGVKLPAKGAQNWNSAAMKKLGMNQLNYMLGVNPWDISFLLGVGDKNDAHPHHRAANPEGRNMPGSVYNYNPPVGALFGGVTPDDINIMDPDTLSWANYHIAETCIDGTAMFVASNTVAVREEDRNRAPEKVNVEIRYAGYDSAIVKITQDLRGPAMILYSTNETGPFNVSVADTVNGVSHEIHMTGLQGGTTYYFKVVAINIRSEAYTTKWLVDSTRTPFSFTTLVSPLGDADIQNVKVCNLSADTAEIMWYTPNGQYESRVYWDTTLVSADQMTCPNRDDSTKTTCDLPPNMDVAGLPTSFHYVKIGTLKEKTTYYYCVESNGTIRCKDDKGQPLKFKTPVTQYKFAVHTYQYYEQGLEGMDRIALNIVNGEDRAFDSLELRLYVTARPDQMEPQEGVNNQPGLCPLMTDVDICIAYDEAGFNQPCETNREIRDLLRGAPPVKLEDTYNPVTGEYDWYIPIPMGSTTIKSSSRMRLDLAFSDGYYQNGKCDPLYKAADKRMNASSGDWTWAPHLRSIDGADYEGMPVWGKDDGDQETAPVNPFVVVYRKDEFVSGFSPSYREMITKKANYEITMAFDAPFNVSNGSYVEIDSTISTMHLTGQAFITENGYVTDIWVNGVALTREQLAKAAIYDPSTGRYALDIPAKMSIGTNKVDVTVFAGPDPNCADCAENGGCAFVNRSYYVQFSKGDRTQSSILLFAENGEPLSTLALPDGTFKIDGSTKFRIELRDKDNRGNTTMNAYIFNSRTGDSTVVTLKRTNEDLGYFSSDFLTAQAKDGGLPNVVFYGGDTIMVKYVDPEDEDDRDSTRFWSSPTRPVPQVASIVSNTCTASGTAIAMDGLSIKFTGNQFNGTTIVMDSVLIKLDAADSFEGKEIAIVPSATVVGDSVYLEIADTLIGTAAPMGKVVVYMREDGIAATDQVEITDKIRPKLTSVSILENENHENKQDTLKFIFSEPVDIADTKTWPLSVYDGQNAVDATGITIISVTTSDEGKSWQYVIEGNYNQATGATLIKPQETASVVAGFGIMDASGNRIATCSPVTIIEAIRPVPVQYAKITDFTGDGQPDEIYVEFVRTLRDKDIPDTIDVYWGKPAIYQAFTMPAGGWNLSSIEAGKISTILTQIDPDHGEWIKKPAITVCDSKEQTNCSPRIDSTKTDSLGFTIYDTTEVCTTIEVEDKSSCVTTQDSTFIPKLDTLKNADGTPQTKDSTFYHSVIKIAVDKDIYKNQTYGADDGKGRIRPRIGPVENQISDITHALLDFCPPVILSAQWSGYDVGDEERGTLDDVLLTFSEPVDTVSHPYFVEREREGKTGVYYSPMHNSSLSVVVVTPTSIRLSYMHKEPEALWIGDNVRLHSDTTFSAIRDQAGLYAGVDHPWVPINGSVTEVMFAIKSVESITKSRNNYDVYYGNTPFAENENFRLTVKNKAGETIILAAGDNELKRVNSAPIANYKSAGPVFEIEVSLPFGNSRNYQLAFDLDIFSNMGSYVINTHFSDSTSYMKDFISAGSTLTLYLEWCAPEDYPVSSTGKKIGTGPYIAKFKTKASSSAPETLEEGDDGRAISDSDTFTKTFGFRRVKQ
ncbi:MAG: glycoside hydrolase family 9 protein [Fibrobacter sp.]|nr:glycoside hydrolase family 9 protein [Fibrobacter sp.]